MIYEGLYLSGDIEDLRVDINCLLAFSSSHGSSDLLRYVVQLEEDFKKLCSNAEICSQIIKPKVKEKSNPNNVIRFHK